MLSALPGPNESPEDNDDKIHRRMGPLSTQVTDVHLPRRFQISPNQNLVLVSAKRKYLTAKSRFGEGYVESFAVMGATIGALSVVTMYLFVPEFRMHLFLDVPSAILVGAIVGCMIGSLLGCVFGMASSQIIADTTTDIKTAPSFEQRRTTQIIAAQNGSKLKSGAQIIPLTSSDKTSQKKRPGNGSALG
jgi:hypothetical protein